MIDLYLSWVGQGNSCKPISGVSTLEADADGYAMKSEDRSTRWEYMGAGDVVSQKLVVMGRG